jgi:hypothetical protein
MEVCKAQIQELNSCQVPARIKVLMEEIEKCVSDDRIPQISFNGRQEMLLATAYTDEWTKTPQGHFRHYFICLAGQGDPCLHMITSKKWTQKFPGEAWHAGQRWYCEENTWNQRHLYKAKWGCIIEIRQGSNIYYTRAEVPDQTKLDILGLKYERQYGSQMTAAQLYDRIPIVNPTETEWVLPVNPANGIYKLRSKADLDALTSWSWEQLYNFVS